MKITENHDLTLLNTFGVKAKARFFAVIKNEQDLSELIADPIFKENKRLFIGGGSNMLFVEDFPGIVVLNKMKGIEIVSEDAKSATIRVMGGEMWHDFVEFSVEKGYWGIENLSLIPGTVGAAPVQNIGAYGTEVKDTIEEVETYDLSTGRKKIFKNAECLFGYRDSVWKGELRGKYFISAVTFRLRKQADPNIGYKGLKEYLEKNGIIPKSSKEVSDAVAAIRRSKLPDPAETGNAGSFFKNVFVDKKKLEELLRVFPEIPHFEEEGNIKIPSAWLIEQCGWKGKRIGNAGVHEKQPLVLVNLGGATGKEIWKLSQDIIDSVKEKFGLSLEREVNIIVG